MMSTDFALTTDELFDWYEAAPEGTSLDRHGFRKVGVIASVLVIVASMFWGMARPASAASYVCCVNVQADAAARSTPWVTTNFRGYVNPDNWFASTQKSLVKCYADGGWATGNYSSNRWFLVYVSTSYGYTNWFYVHSSYVYNQKTVPRC